MSTLGSYGPHVVNAEFRRADFGDNVRIIIGCDPEHELAWVVSNGIPEQDRYVKNREEAALFFVQQIASLCGHLVVGPTGSVMVERAGQALLLSSARRLREGIEAHRAGRPVSSRGYDEDVATVMVEAATVLINKLMGQGLFSAHQLIESEPENNPTPTLIRVVDARAASSAAFAEPTTPRTPVSNDQVNVFLDDLMAGGSTNMIDDREN
ncbi:hypothetical protein ACIGXM_14610 [Kitasatospora sp. NPDC052896]|uniref:hypothetical protein n=1 Tax=Kitasatospora sp. NPDC052896 TaxID=3364061 RepID=UPI0037C542F1